MTFAASRPTNAEGTRVGVGVDDGEVSVNEEREVYSPLGSSAY